MDVVLGYIILLIGCILGLTTWSTILFNILFIKVFRLQNIGLVYVYSFFCIYILIDFAWYYFYDYHLPFLALLLIIIWQSYSRTDNRLDDNGLLMDDAETFTVGLFALYTFIFVEFNWV
tara:strand:+ start:105 stop:461 length:357 start_codon:yes stop_codon:yes gene_type:complete